MPTGVKDKYNIAINSKGYMLRGAPGKIAYAKSVVPSQIDRLAVSDLAYSDFAGQGLFYLAQTDWSAGVKAEKTWRDDAKFYWSTNIDAYSQQGALKVELELSSYNDFAENIVCGENGVVNDVTTEYVGCEDDGSGYVKIYGWLASSWTEIAGTDFGTNQNLCSQLLAHKNTLWAGTVGVGNTDVVASWDGTNWTDHSAAILTASTATAINAARCVCEYATKLWVLCDDYVGNKVFIMSTVDNGTTWVEELYFADNPSTPVAICGFNNKIYYLLSRSSVLELRVYDPTASTDISVAIFNGASAPSYGAHNMLRLFQNKLVITIPNTKIYELDSSGNLTEIWNRDSFKYSESAPLAEGYVYYGAVQYDDKLYWGNLIWDGEAWFNHKRPSGDSASYRLIPLHINAAGDIRYRSDEDFSILWKNAATYKTTIANNYLYSNEMAPVGAIDKLLDSVTIMFEKMTTGQSIKVEYSIDERSTWVTVGTRTYSATDSATVKTWQIPGSIIFNKIWFRISLDGSATSPALTDLVMAYKPMPDYKNRWDLRLNFTDSVKLLNKQDEQRTGQELNSELWNEKVTKQRVVFEDVDYVNCNLVSGMAAGDTSALVDSTKRFPRQGRIRAVSGSIAEEMTYTSAVTNKLLGISRGKRGTAARAYSADQQLDSGYDAYIENITSYVSFTDENKTEDSAQVLLIEA